MSGQARFQGVVFLDHTADVGIAVQAPDLETLFHRSALAMLSLLRGDEDPPTSPKLESKSKSKPKSESESAEEAEGHVEERLSGGGRGRADVLATWLRELLFLHDVHDRDYAAVRFDRLDEAGFEATVRTRAAAPAVREIKGVTYHELTVERLPGGWKGRVIFDV